MRELTVYYCGNCGHYGFYQTLKDALCPACQNAMTALPMSYQSFMNLDFDMRDKIISNQLTEGIFPNSSVVQRITALEQCCDSRFIIIQLKQQIEDLQTENANLSDKNREQEHTIQWMHDMIWDLTARLKRENSR